MQKTWLTFHNVAISIPTSRVVATSNAMCANGKHSKYVKKQFDFANGMKSSGLRLSCYQPLMVQWIGTTALTIIKPLSFRKPGIDHSKNTPGVSSIIASDQ